MGKVFESKIFSIGLFLAIVIALAAVYFFNSQLGIKDYSTFIGNNILLFLITLLAISVPIYSSIDNYQKQKKEEEKMVLVSVALYVGNEILDNAAALNDILIQISEANKGLADVPKEAEMNTIAGLWSAFTEEILAVLDDKWHQNMVASGLVAKAPDSLKNKIRSTYQKMDNLRKQCRRMAKFCEMALNPQGMPKSFFDNYLKSQLPDGIKATTRDIDFFLKEAEETTVAINEFIEPYGSKIEVFTYAKPEK